MKILELYNEWKKCTANQGKPLGSMLRMGGIEQQITVKKQGNYVIEFYQNKTNVPSFFPYHIEIIQANGHEEAGDIARGKMIAYMDEHEVAAKLAPYTDPHAEARKQYMKDMYGNKNQ